MTTSGRASAPVSVKVSVNLGYPFLLRREARLPDSGGAQGRAPERPPEAEPCPLGLGQLGPPARLDHVAVTQRQVVAPPQGLQGRVAGHAAGQVKAAVVYPLDPEVHKRQPVAQARRSPPVAAPGQDRKSVV